MNALVRTCLLLLVALSIAPSLHAASYNIDITDSGFDPDYLVVTNGDTVYWWNEDYTTYADHSTYCPTYEWDSGAIPVGYGVYLTVSQTGTFDYYDDVGGSGSGTLVIMPVSVAPPPPSVNFIPATNCVDMVYDQPRDILYITCGTNVLRYQLGSSSFLPPFALSGNLKGIDISPDDNYLVVGDGSAVSNSWVHVINLTTGQSHRAIFPTYNGESGSYAIAFGGDGAALVTATYPGSGWVPLRRFDPKTGASSIISALVPDSSMVSASGDLTTIILAEADNSGGPLESYSVAQGAFTHSGGTGWFNYECGASRDASLFAIPTYGGTFVYNGSFNLVTNLGGQALGAAFHPAADAVFFPIVGTTYVRAYSTTNWAMLAQYDFGYTFSNPGNHAFTNGRIRISPDGQIIFVTVYGGVSYLRPNLNLPLSHRLLVSGNPAAYGTPAPLPYGSYWLGDGTNLTISVPSFVPTNGTAMICTGWTGTGSATGSGGGTNVTFTLTNNTSITWNWTALALSANKSGVNQIVLNWPSVAGHTYDLLLATNATAAFTPVLTGIAATPPLNTLQRPIGPGPVGMYKIRMH